MSTGYSAAGRCWPTQQEALDAFYSATPVSVDLHISPDQSHAYLILSVPRKFSTGWHMQQYVCERTGSTFGACAVPTLELPQNVTGICTLASGDPTDPVESFFDGHILGWGVALAMAAAWGVHILRRAAT